MSNAFSFICNQRTRLAIMISDAPNTEDVYKTNELHGVQSSQRENQTVSQLSQTFAALYATRLFLSLIQLAAVSYPEPNTSKIQY